jgi:hypothetical protein
MFGSLVAGFGCALGHHAFYGRLAGQEVPSGNYTVGSWDFSRQEVNVQIGTGLAFLTKALLTLAVGTAYVQLFWRIAVKTGRRSRMDHLDISYSVLNDILSLFRLKFWWKRPLLLLLALTAWYGDIKYLAKVLTVLMNSAGSFQSLLLLVLVRFLSANPLLIRH